MPRKLKALVDDLMDVPEEHRDLYAKRDDGKYALDAEGVEDVSGLKSALDKERKARSDLDKRLKKFGDADPDEIERLREEAEARQSAEEDVEKRIARIEDKAKKDLAKLEEKVLARDNKIHQLIAENVANEAITEAEGYPKLLMPHVMAQVKVEEVDGDFRAVVIDPKTKTTRDGVEVKDLVTEMRALEDFAGAFRGTKASGSGAQSTGSRTPTVAADRKKDGGSVEDTKRASGAYAAI